jgi:hypothetical protein
VYGAPISGLCSKFEGVQVQLIDLFGFRISSMIEIAPANMNALRWDALLAEYGVVEKEHRELLFCRSPGRFRRSRTQN